MTTSLRHSLIISVCTAQSKSLQTISPFLAPCASLCPSARVCCFSVDLWVNKEVKPWINAALCLLMMWSRVPSIQHVSSKDALTSRGRKEAASHKEPIHNLQRLHQAIHEHVWGWRERYYTFEWMLVFINMWHEIEKFLDDLILWVQYFSSLSSWSLWMKWGV